MAFWEQVKEKTHAVQIKMRMLLLENSIEAGLSRLGSRTYELAGRQDRLWDDDEIQSWIQDVSSKKNELALLREEFERSWREEAKELKSNLEKRGGLLEQVEISSRSVVAGKKIKDTELPREVLLGPILRGQELIIPDGETVLQAADRVTLLGKKKDVEATAKLLKGLS